MLTLSTAYFGSIAHFHLLAQKSPYQIEAKEHFVKQSQRNRCLIQGPNSILKLSIPLKKWNNNSMIQDIKISYDEDWQSQHWRSIQTAYRPSPFFEFYEDELRPLFEFNEVNLLRFNERCEDKIKELLMIEAKSNFTTEYQDLLPDWRSILHLKNDNLIKNSYFPPYQQVFSDRYPFHPNLSILDLLFNLGAEAKTYLNQVQLQAEPQQNV